MPMLSPFQIIFPPETWGKKILSQRYPINCKYKISIALPLLINVDEASFFIQSFSGLDYFLQLWSFSLATPGSVTLKVEQPFITLAICLKGSNYITPENIIVRDKKYSLCYYPKGSHGIDLPEGDTVLVMAIPPVYYLHSMAVEHLVVRELYNSLQFESKEKQFLKDLSISHSVLRIIKLLEASRERAASLDHTVRMYILHLLSLYNKQLRIVEDGTNGKVYPGAKWIDQIIEHIHTHLSDEDLTKTAKIAEAFQLRIDTMRKEFKRITGKTIQHYIQDERLCYARKLLAENELQVVEVANMVGYSAASNFVRAYRKKFGHPPGKE